MNAQQLLEEIKQWAISNKEESQESADRYSGRGLYYGDTELEAEAAHQGMADAYDHLLGKLETLADKCKPTFLKGELVKRDHYVPVILTQDSSYAVR